MTQATTAQHIAARNDRDLYERIVAAAEQANIYAARSWVDQHLGAIIAAKIDADGDGPGTEITTIAAVYAYAVATYKVPTPPPAPGANPAAVTDPQLAAAIAKVKSAQQTPQA